MLNNKDITVKQLIFLLNSCGFKKCEIWTCNAYVRANCGSKEYRAHRIASAKIDLLFNAGLDYKDAQKLVIMEGKQKANKRNLALLGTPIWTGDWNRVIEELHDKHKQAVLNKIVCNCYIKGPFRNKIQIVIDDFG